MGKTIICDHPLIQHKLGILRQKDTGAKEFRELVTEIAMLMGYELTKDFPLEEVEIETPMGKAHVKSISGKKSCNCTDFKSRSRHGRRFFKSFLPQRSDT